MTDALSLTADQEKQVKKLKRRLEGWRVVLLPVKSVLLWEESWHPVLIFCAISCFYLTIWLLDPNILTILASLGMIINLVDFLVPIALSHLMSPNSWTGQQEKAFEDICKGLVVHYDMFVARVSAFLNMRETKPIMYYVVSIGCLFVLLWLGKSIDNNCLFYIATLTLSMYPGLSTRGLINSMNSVMKGAIKKKE